MKLRLLLGLVAAARRARARWVGEREPADRRADRRPRPAHGHLFAARRRSRHRHVRRRADRARRRRAPGVRPDRAADEASAARARARNRSGHELCGGRRRGQRRLSGRQGRAVRPGVRRRDGRRDHAGQRAHRQGCHGRGHRLRLRRESSRPGRPRDAQRQALQRRVREPPAGLEQHGRRPDREGPVPEHRPRLGPRHPRGRDHRRRRAHRARAHRRRPRREPRLLLDRRGAVHDRRRDRVRPPARPARCSGASV